MKSISLKTKIVTGLITGGMLLSSVSLALATTNKPASVSEKAPMANELRRGKGNQVVRQQNLKANLAKLVTAGTITKDQSDKITAAVVKEEALKKADFEKTKDMTEAERKTYLDSNKINHVNPLKSLVDNKTITQAQADKIGFCGPGKFNMRAPFANEFKHPKANLKTTLKAAVTAKIITQSESDKILAYENSKVKTDDKKERIKGDKPDLFKELVTSKILSQEKADALKANIKVQKQAERQKNLETNLTKLVTDKTITQEQSDKIKDAMVKEEALRKADFEKTKDMTEAERKAYREENKINHTNPLKSLVNNGTITQAQADKVGPCGLKGHGGPGGHGGHRNK